MSRCLINDQGSLVSSSNSSSFQVLSNPPPTVIGAQYNKRIRPSNEDWRPGNWSVTDSASQSRTQWLTLEVKRIFLQSTHWHTQTHTHTHSKSHERGPPSFLLLFTSPYKFIKLELMGRWGSACLPACLTMRRKLNKRPPLGFGLQENKEPRPGPKGCERCAPMRCNPLKLPPLPLPPPPPSRPLPPNSPQNERQLPLSSAAASLRIIYVFLFSPQVKQHTHSNEREMEKINK